MQSITSFARRYPLIIFFAIAYVTSFVGGYLDYAYPSDFWAVFVYGPFIGAFIVTALAEGRSGLKEWFSRIGRWRVGLRWYAVALLLPVVLQLITFGLNLALGAPAPTDAQLSAWPDLLPEFVFIYLFIGLAEEPGFRGFALPRLLKGRSALAATLILGILHTVWHLPLFISGSEPLATIPIIVSGSVLIGWLFLHTRGSVLLAMLMHTLVNTAGVYFSNLVSEVTDVQYTALLATVYAAAAVILVAVMGPDLTGKPVVAQPVGSMEG